MLVYGDRHRTEAPGAVLARIERRLAPLDHTFPGIVRHGALTAAFIEAGQLAQGLADAEFEARGGDGPSLIQDAAMALVMRLARGIAASWTSGFSALPAGAEAELSALAALPLPPTVTIRAPEGYAFYAVYPEAYLEAAWEVPQPPQVIGLRSIGTSLAAMVAVGADAAPPLTVRPTGHPFNRRLQLLEPIPEASCYAVVDEGPGLSGSSFGCVGDLLEGRRIVWFPSNRGDLGPAANERHRARWASAHRVVKDFDEVVLPHLSGWFADLAGPPTQPLQDLSAGAWRAARGLEAPADPPRERRKYLLRTASGAWLLRFAGLGALGEVTLARARVLHDGGFTPGPLGLRHGFLIERWHDEATVPTDRAALLDHLGRYLAFRADAFPAGAEDGAGLSHLREMAIHNAAQAGVTLLPPLHEGPVRRVHTDNRLHLWEWLQLPDGRILKADAVDHSDGHDLIGCQDIAWDVAGARVEFDLTSAETAALGEAAGADPHLVAALVPCYAAFQLGLWSLGDNRGQMERYRRVLQAAAAT